MNGRMRVCVIGAGFAGLAAADALTAAGVEVMVLEARDRVGGRVWSHRPWDGTRIEMGAEFVTEGYRKLPETAARLGLGLAPMGMSFGKRDPRGGIGATVPALRAATAAFAAAVAAGDLQGVSVAQLLDRLPINPGARELIGCRIQVSYAHPAGDIAADSVRDVEQLFDGSEARRVKGGNQGIALRLAARLGAAVRLSSPARRVAHTPGGVRVSTDGDEVEAEACVVAVPAPVAGGIAFQPPLPEWKAAAIARTVSGHAAKLFVPLSRPAAPSSVMAVPEHFWTWTAGGEDGESAAVMGAFAGSSPALARLAVAAGAQRWLSRVRRLRPDLELDEGGAVLSTWIDDPWACGAYSTRSPGQPRSDDEVLRRPCGRIAFAGEHTAGEWFGTMEGALLSGERAAADVLAMA
jgi:monoamine oxidase